ncbi:very short patch repair endonuclease [Methylopila turkensis]|uniref:very short patch repair endonuclease n=1 Tax=Methylopila turkensis TaxID=1437816 RepID=UPI0022F2BC32|nr:very short patch repair endonuclease [Methylopila turkensis]
MSVETSAARSAVMRAVKARDTKPERTVRRLAHALGYRFRLHRKDLPGTPDLVFPTRKKVVFVHGCFWHGHDCARGARTPKANADYWRAKVERNRARDARAVDDLAALGWEALVLWECALKDADAVACLLRGFLGAPGAARDSSKP